MLLDTTPARPDELAELAASEWFYGARTVAQAIDETGLSRDKLFELMADGVLRWKPHGGRGTRLIVWIDLVKYLDGLDGPDAADRG